MKLSTITKLFMVGILGFAFSGCTTEEAPPVETEIQAEEQISTTQSAVSCTPGAETCDYGCNFDGAQWDGPTPTTDDCIIRCNTAGNAWQLVTNCGWAWNFPYSASCLNSQPHPICQNN